MTHIDDDKLNHLLNLTVGMTSGPQPIDQLQQIRQLKLYESQRIKKYLLLRKSDQVMDLGSGPGFIADNLAEAVDHIHCVDINSDFIQLAKETLGARSNITYHVTEHGRLNTLPLVTAIYANQVFFQFNLYDIYQYLIECYNVLTNKGRMIFEIVNDEHLDVSSDTWQCQNKSYQTKPMQRTTTYNNKNTVIRIIQQIGFDLIKTFDDREHTYFVIIKK
jgi:ubiquinone/menaquinone biosynthesis C-methylase UbiE